MEGLYIDMEPGLVGFCLTQCGLVTPYGNINLGNFLLR